MAEPAVPDEAVMMEVMMEAMVEVVEAVVAAEKDEGRAEPERRAPEPGIAVRIVRGLGINDRRRIDRDILIRLVGGPFGALPRAVGLPAGVPDDLLRLAVDHRLPGIVAA